MAAVGSCRGPIFNPVQHLSVLLYLALEVVDFLDAISVGLRTDTLAFEPRDFAFALQNTANGLRAGHYDSSFEPFGFSSRSIVFFR